MLIITGFVFGGGIVTNTNQSADFIRSLNRNASTDIDAAFFNPAGVTQLENGMHFYLSSQTITQGREVTSDWSTLHGDMFEGSTFVPVLPNIYFAYKMDKLAIAGGFTVIGGGGSAEYADGLPSFEVPVSMIPASLVAAGIPTTDYNFDVSFEGSSAYMGGQATVAYKVNDMISVAVGARYFTAKNTYVGHLKDIMIDPTYPAAGGTGDMTSAPNFFTNLSAVMTGGAALATGGAAQYAAGSAQAAAGAVAAQAGADGLLPFAGTAYDTLSFSTLVSYGVMTQGLVDTIGGGVNQLGGTFDASSNTPANTHAFYTGAAANLTSLSTVYADSSTYYTGYSAYLTTQAAAMDTNAMKTADIKVDAEETGSGFAPLFGLYITPFDGLGIGIRYEGMAAMELETATKVDGTGLFPDGKKSNADMPAMLGIGVSYKVMPSMRLEFDYNMYFNEDVNWDGKEAFVTNGSELGLGLDFSLSEALLLSGGFNLATSGAEAGYQSDLSYSVNSTTLGFGARYRLSPKMAVSFGVSNTSYDTFTKKDVAYDDDGLLLGEETYTKTALDIAIGLGYSF